MDIDTVEKVHSIGHRLKDAKTTLGRDIKVGVADLDISGTQGEVINIPQWVGKVLADNDLGRLDEPDMLNELTQSLSKEKLAGPTQLSTLDQHFYIKLKAALNELGRDDYNKYESMMVELFRMRRGKIIKLADSIKLNAEQYNKLSVEEAIFYRSIHDTSVEFERQVMGGGDEQ